MKEMPSLSELMWTRFISRVVAACSEKAGITEQNRRGIWIVGVTDVLEMLADGWTRFVVAHQWTASCQSVSYSCIV
jgi:phage terminase large subunit-like protein